MDFSRSVDRVPKNTGVTQKSESSEDESVLGVLAKLASKKQLFTGASYEVETGAIWKEIVWNLGPPSFGDLRGHPRPQPQNAGDNFKTSGEKTTGWECKGRQGHN